MIKINKITENLTNLQHQFDKEISGGAEELETTDMTEQTAQAPQEQQTTKCKKCKTTKCECHETKASSKETPAHIKIGHISRQMTHERKSSPKRKGSKSLERTQRNKQIRTQEEQQEEQIKQRIEEYKSQHKTTISNKFTGGKSNKPTNTIKQTNNQEGNNTNGVQGTQATKLK